MPVKAILITVLSASMFLLPISAAALLMHLREKKRIFAFYLFSVYLCAVYWLTGPPDITYFRWDPDVSWIPFAGMIDDPRSTVLNVALFMPLGAVLPLLWDRYKSIGKTVLFGFLLSLTIELSQLCTYRATDINDLITNTAGTLAGYAIYRLFLPKNIADHRNDAPVVLGISFAGMFFAEPFLHRMLERFCG